MINQFSRSQVLLGEAAMEKLSASRVAIFGIGGVGSYAVEALARSGVGHFVLIDNDVISLTNVNRQLHATMDTIGRSKTQVMAERIRSINPEAEVREINEFYLPENHDLFFTDRLDYIVDAIDTVTGKLDLVQEAEKRGIPIISSMGAGNKLNPADFEVADIYQTSVCPLARVMRQKLKKLGIKKLKVVYSKEEPIKAQAPAEETAGSTGRDALRRSVPGSIAFVPSVVGLMAASEVVKDLVRDVCPHLVQRVTASSKTSSC